VRVDFGKAEGPKCKMSKIPGIMNYFSTDNVVDRVMRRCEEVTGSSVGRVSGMGEEKRGLGEVWGAPGVIGVAFVGPGEGTGGGGQSNGGDE
jgi:hypothetical protein